MFSLAEPWLVRCRPDDVVKRIAPCIQSLDDTMAKCKSDHPNGDTATLGRAVKMCRQISFLAFETIPVSLDDFAVEDMVAKGKVLLLLHPLTP